MRTILCLVLLLAAPGARAELFQMSGTLTCGSPTPEGKLESSKLSTLEILAAALDTGDDDATTKRFALVYDSENLRILVAERCDGSEQMLVAINSENRGTNGEPKNGKLPYAYTQILTVTEWTGSVEQGHVTCNFSGDRDANTADILSAKGKCEGALSLFDSLVEGVYSYCTLKAKIGKPLKVTNDCPT